MEEELTNYLLLITRPLVDEPHRESLRVTAEDGPEGGIFLRLHAADECVRHLIGTGGGTAKAVRRLMLGRAKVVGFRRMVDVRVGENPLL